MSMMPPHMMMQNQGGPAKPLFPSAVPASSPGATIVGADFKPITSGKYFDQLYGVSKFQYYEVLCRYFELAGSQLAYY